MNKEAMTLKEGKGEYVGGLGGRKRKEEWCDHNIVFQDRKEEESLVERCQQ